MTDFRPQYWESLATLPVDIMSGIQATLRGGAHEVVHITAVTPQGKVATADVTLGTDGRAELKMP